MVTPSVRVAARPPGGKPPGFARDGEVSIGTPPGDALRSGYLTDIHIVPQGSDLYRSARAP